MSSSWHSSINGVKEMRGFRETFNIGFDGEASDDLNVTDNSQCDSDDDVETSALLVWNNCCMYNALNFAGYANVVYHVRI